MSYSILAYYDDDSSPTSTVHFVKNIKDKHTLVDAIFNLANTKIKDEILNYEIQFLSCSSELTNCERKRIMKNHRQNYINEINAPATVAAPGLRIYIFFWGGGFEGQTHIWGGGKI